ncbi:MAG: hypothetical protein KBF76_20660, partial [Verrucomicrobiales bacterium]|nr:hypothetical protein [Verrucomicrobiales bacterium]
NSINSPHRHPSTRCSPTGFAGSVQRRRGVGGGSERILWCRGEIGQASSLPGACFLNFRISASRMQPVYRPSLHRSALAPIQEGKIENPALLFHLLSRPCLRVRVR